MELIFELLLELALEGGIEASKSSKVPKPVRYLIIAVITLFFTAVIGLIALVGALLMKDNLLLGIFFILLAALMFVLCVIKFKKLYLKKRSGENYADR